MAAAPHTGEAGRIIAAPTGPLIVAASVAGNDAPELSVVVPTLNESENIVDFLAAVRRTLDACLPGRYEVIVVDDDSADGTGTIAAGLMDGFPQLRVVRRQNEGGLAVAVAECCYSNSQRKAIGADVNVPAKTQICRDLFGDYASRIIVSTVEPDEIRSRAERAGLRATLLGKVGGSRLVLNYEGDRAIDVAIDELETAWRQGLPSLL